MHDNYHLRCMWIIGGGEEEEEEEDDDYEYRSSSRLVLEGGRLNSAASKRPMNAIGAIQVQTNVLRADLE